MRRLKITSLPNINSWVDRDEIMLHACFQILKDYIDKEKGDVHCNYEAHKDFIDEIRFLYNWWEKRRITDRNSSDDEDNEMLLRLMKVRCALWT